MSLTLALTALAASNWKTYAKIAGIAIAALLLIGGPCWYVHRETVKTYEAKIAVIKAVAAEEKREALEWQLAAERAATAAVDKEVQNARIAEKEHAVRVAAAHAATAKLRHDFQAFVSAHTSSSPAAASGSNAAPEVLSDVFGRVAEAAGRFAEEADAAVIAGRACEGVYNGVSESTKPTEEKKGESE